MNAADIRKLNEDCQEKALQSKSPAAHDAALKSLECSLLAELAAQLAEANEHLAKIANPLLAYDGPRWVHFKRGLGELLIDANGVIGVGRETGELTCIICAAGKRFVDGTVEEVCKKLNIPIGG